MHVFRVRLSSVKYKSDRRERSETWIADQLLKGIHVIDYKLKKAVYTLRCLIRKRIDIVNNLYLRKVLDNKTVGMHTKLLYY
jgi:hypothetical protein